MVETYVTNNVLGLKDSVQLYFIPVGTDLFIICCVYLSYSHGYDPLAVVKSVNVITLIWYSEKFKGSLALDNIKYNYPAF